MVPVNEDRLVKAVLDDREIICVVEHYKWGQFCMDKIAVANGSNHRQSKVLMCSCKEV